MLQLIIINKNIIIDTTLMYIIIKKFVLFFI